MKERPILFSTDMVQAILDGRKTQTRRVHKNQNDCQKILKQSHDWELKELMSQNPYGKKGDILWVREKFIVNTYSGEQIRGPIRPLDVLFANETARTQGFKPSIHMPKSAARIWLQLTQDPYLERLQDISNNDAKAEGIKFSISSAGFCGYDYLSGGYNLMTNPRMSFFYLWKNVHGIGRYQDLPNPYVWVIKFKVLSTTGRPASLDRKEAFHA